MEDRIKYMKLYYLNNKDKWKTYNKNTCKKKKSKKIKKNITFEIIEKNIILIFD